MAAIFNVDVDSELQRISILFDHLEMREKKFSNVRGRSDSIRYRSA